MTTEITFAILEAGKILGFPVEKILGIPVEDFSFRTDQGGVANNKAPTPPSEVPVRIAFRKTKQGGVSVLRKELDHDLPTPRPSTPTKDVLNFRPRSMLTPSIMPIVSQDYPNIENDNYNDAATCFAE